MERDIKGRFLPKNYHWYYIDNYQVLSDSLNHARMMYREWRRYPI